MSTKYLYHGSKKELEVLVPSQAFGFGGEADRHFAVYAVKEMELAIPFAFSVIDITKESIFKVDTDIRPPKVILVNCNLDWSKKGYVYKLSTESFEKADELQWVSKVAVEPIEKIKIDPRLYKSWVKFECT